MREEYSKARMVFLVKSTDRVISSEPLRPPNPDCPVCGVAQSRIDVDLDRASLNDLVEDLLRLELGYGSEFSVTSDAGVLYDPELDDNLPKKLSDLNIGQDSFITVVDEEIEDPRVNLVLSVSGKELPADTRPIALVENFVVVRKKSIPNAGMNGHASEAMLTNGDGVSSRKRSAQDAGFEGDIAAKRGKVMEEPLSKAPGDDDIILVGDDNPGPIVLD